jgi:hypothetical protein
MGHDDRRHLALFEDPAGVGDQLLTQNPVERAQGLVEHHQSGVGGEGSGQSDPLLLASRQGLDASLAKAGQADPGQRLFDLGVDRSSPAIRRPKPTLPATVM